MKRLAFLGTQAPHGGEPIRMMIRPDGKVTEFHFHRSGYYIARVPDSVAENAARSAPSSFSVMTKDMMRRNPVRPRSVFQAFLKSCIHNAPDESVAYISEVLKKGILTDKEKMIAVVELNHARALVDAGNEGKRGESAAVREQEEETEAQADAAAEAARRERVRDVLLEQADPDDPEHWAGTGENAKFSLNALKTLMGDRKVYQTDLDAAWPGLTRQNLAEFRQGDESKGPAQEIAGVNGVDGEVDGKDGKKAGKGGRQPRPPQESEVDKMTDAQKIALVRKTLLDKADTTNRNQWTGSGEFSVTWMEAELKSRSISRTHIEAAWPGLTKETLVAFRNGDKSKGPTGAE